MPRYYLLIKKRTSKRWQGAVPTKRGVSLAKIKSVVRKTLRRGYSVKIVTESQLKRLLLKTAPRGSRRARVRRVRRHKRVRRRAHRRRRVHRRR